MNVSKKLQSWRDAGLITEEQVAAIRAHEQNRSGARFWIVAGLGGVGGLAIAAGLISLIAANWNDIPAAVKLAGMGCILAGSLIAASELTRRGRDLSSDLFLFGHGLATLAMIGLVGQIYHLSGEPWRPFAVCAALALPPAVISARSLLSDLPIAYSLLSLVLYLIDSHALDRELRGFGAGLFAAAIGGAFLLASDLLARAHAGASSALRRWGGAVVATAAVAAAVIVSVRFTQETPPPMIVAAAIVAGLLGARLFATRRIAAGAAAFLTLVLLVAAARWLGSDTDVARRFAGFSLFCAACAAMAMASAQAGRKRATDLFTLAIAARIVVLFIEMIRSLALTGVGLLLTGAVFCGVAWAWWRLHGMVGGQSGPPSAGQEAS